MTCHLYRNALYAAISPLYFPPQPNPLKMMGGDWSFKNVAKAELSNFCISCTENRERAND